MADSFRGFVWDPNCGRGTLTIVWSCLTTIFLSTWTSHHPDIQREKWRENRILEFIFCVCFPEGAASVALGEMLNAVSLRRKLRRCTGWGKLSLKQAFVVIKGGVLINATTVLDGSDLVRHARSGSVLLRDLPSDEKIERRSKSDTVSKIIAVCQGTWFAANLIGRLVRGYHVSPLEDMTAAYLACGLLMVTTEFRCPQGIEELFLVEVRTAAAPRDNAAPQGPEKRTDRTTAPAADVEAGRPRRATTWRATMASPRGTLQTNEGKDLNEMSNKWGGMSFFLLLAVFTGIHLASWGYPFPSQAEAWVWRALSVANGLSTGILTPRWASQPELAFFPMN